jgi:hypothetical protein
MKKLFVAIISSTVVLLWIEAFAQKKAKIVYDFPPEMKEHVRVEYEKLCEKGRVLYEMNCAKCHNTVVKGREVVPDFKPEQLRGYELRVANERHESNLPDEQVTEEELGYIMSFLAYKKKNK